MAKRLNWNILAITLLLHSAAVSAEMYVSLGVGSVRGDIGTTTDDDVYSDLTFGQQFAGGFFIQGTLTSLGDFGQITRNVTTAGNQRTSVGRTLEQSARAFAFSLGQSFQLSRRLYLRPFVGVHVYRLDTYDITTTTGVDIADPTNPVVISSTQDNRSRKDTETAGLYGVTLSFRAHQNRSLSFGATRFDDIDRTAIYVRMTGWF